MKLIKVKFLSPAVMDDFPGATWMSGLGPILRGLWCERDACSSEECDECRCAFAVFWKTTTAQNPVVFAGGGQSRGGGDLPKPCILNALDSTRQRYGAGDKPRVTLTLVGHAAQSWPDWMRAFRRLGERGVGRDYKCGRGRFRVQRVFDSDGMTPLAGPLDKALISPPRVVTMADCERRANELLQQGGDRCLTPVFLRPLQLRQMREHSELSFCVLWDALITRVQNLACYFT